VLTRICLSLVLSGLVGCGGNPRAPVEERFAQSQHPAHTVLQGDTLYSIAFRYGLDYRKVAAANRIDTSYRIYPGQRIVLKEAELTQAVPAPAALPTQRSSPAYTPAPASPGPVATGSITTTPAPSPIITTKPPSVESSKPALPAVKPVPPAAPSPAATDTFVGGKVGTWRWPASGPVTRGYSGSVHKGIDIGGARGDPVVAVAAGKVVYAGTGIVGFGELLIIKHNEVYLSAYGHNDRLLVSEGEVVKAGQTIAEKGSSGTDTVKLHFEIRKEGKPVDPQRLLPRR
jgi:lipoprotein NlpD